MKDALRRAVMILTAKQFAEGYYTYCDGVMTNHRYTFITELDDGTCLAVDPVPLVRPQAPEQGS